MCNAMRYLGVNCSSSFAFLALIVDGAVVTGDPPRYAPPSGESSARLDRFFEGFREILADLTPDVVALVQPEQETRFRLSYSALEPRIAMETLVRLATVRSDAGIAMEVLARPTVRSRLGLPASGKLVNLVERVIPEPVGPYWRDKRDLAALAALAAGSS